MHRCGCQWINVKLYYFNIEICVKTVLYCVCCCCDIKFYRNFYCTLFCLTTLETMSFIFLFCKRYSAIFFIFISLHFCNPSSFLFCCSLPLGCPAILFSAGLSSLTDPFFLPGPSATPEYRLILRSNSCSPPQLFVYVYL